MRFVIQIKLPGEKEYSFYGVFGEQERLTKELCANSKSFNSKMGAERFARKKFKRTTVKYRVVKAIDFAKSTEGKDYFMILVTDENNSGGFIHFNSQKKEYFSKGDKIGACIFKTKEQADGFIENLEMPKHKFYVLNINDEQVTA